MDKYILVKDNVIPELMNELESIKNLLVKQSDNVNPFDWIESSVARKMLNISEKTWQTYRNQRIIPFSQFGRKIYVKRSDIENFMNANLITK